MALAWELDTEEQKQLEVYLTMCNCNFKSKTQLFS